MDEHAQEVGNTDQRAKYDGVNDDGMIFGFVTVSHNDFIIREGLLECGKYSGNDRFSI